MVVIAALLSLTVAAGQTVQPNSDRLKWWRDARFGMFIHWGLYAIPAGEWKGKAVPGIGEWIMHRAQIPVAEYEKLAKQFNPTRFDADEWVKTARAAGQRYMVITAKHHDGFAMFRSQVSKYNVYDATPFHRDVIGELAAACKRQGMPLGFYYSQTQDWHEKDGDGNTWDYNPDGADFDKYFHEKAVPQVKELLTQYGPVALIWFDTPKKITSAQSKELADLVRTMQPNCLIDGRIGNNAGDYASTGDNEIPAARLPFDWEAPATLNDTWGFKKDDSNWKSPQTLIRQLVDAASKNGNFLLNVGPTAEGEIPQPSVERLKKVGSWLQINGDAIYGAKPSPYPYEFEWGSITAKSGRLFLNIAEWPKGGKFALYGLESKVQQVALVSKAERPIKFKQSDGTASELELAIPSKAPDPNVSVIALRLDGEPKANSSIIQQPDDSVTLNAYLADRKEGSAMKISKRGIVNSWPVRETLTWKFLLRKGGEYAVTARSAPPKKSSGDTREQNSTIVLKITAAGHSVEHTFEREGEIPDPRNPLTPDIKTELGRISLKPGTVELTAQRSSLDDQVSSSMRFREIVLKTPSPTLTFYRAQRAPDALCAPVLSRTTGTRRPVRFALSEASLF